MLQTKLKMIGTDNFKLWSEYGLL